MTCGAKLPGIYWVTGVVFVIAQCSGSPTPTLRYVECCLVLVSRRRSTSKPLCGKPVSGLGPVIVKSFAFNDKKSA